MKVFFIIVFLLLSKSIFAQNPWPKNSRTGKVELRGSKKISINTSTLVNKNKFVRDWYLNSLTDAKEANFKKWLSRTGNETTYLGLPSNCYFERKVGSEYHKLSFEVVISVKNDVIHYEINNFYFSENGEDSFITMNIEDVFTKNAFASCISCRKSLDIFRTRFRLISSKL